MEVAAKGRSVAALSAASWRAFCLSSSEGITDSGAGVAVANAAVAGVGDGGVTGVAAGGSGGDGENQATGWNVRQNLGFGGNYLDAEVLWAHRERHVGVIGDADVGANVHSLFRDGNHDSQTRGFDDFVAAAVESSGLTGRFAEDDVLGLDGFCGVFGTLAANAKAEDVSMAAEKSFRKIVIVMCLLEGKQ